MCPPPLPASPKLPCTFHHFIHPCLHAAQAADLFPPPFLFVQPEHSLQSQNPVISSSPFATFLWCLLRSHKRPRIRKSRPPTPAPAAMPYAKPGDVCFWSAAASAKSWAASSSRMMVVDAGSMSERLRMECAPRARDLGDVNCNAYALAKISIRTAVVYNQPYRSDCARLLPIPTAVATGQFRPVMEDSKPPLDGAGTLGS